MAVEHLCPHAEGRGRARRVTAGSQRERAGSMARQERRRQPRLADAGLAVNQYAAELAAQ